MFNITDLMQAAHGGDAVNTLSRQFGLQPDQTQKAIDALLPALTVGLQKQTEANASFAALMTTMLTGNHARYFEQPSAAAQPDAAQAGQDILRQLFGAHTPAVNQQVAQHAAALSGVSQQILMQMLPVLASMIMGAMFHSATSGSGGGGLLGQFLNAARGAGVGGLGGMFKQAFPQPPISQPPTGQPGSSQPSPGGALGGLNSWFNTVSEPAAPARSHGATPPSGNAAPPLDPMSTGPVSVGLDALRNMFQTGSAIQQKGLNDFQAMFEQMSGAKPR